MLAFFSFFIFVDSIYTYDSGICEPLDDPKCIEKNNWEIDCSIAQYACPELDATEGRSKKF